MKRFRIFLLLSFLSIFFIGPLCSCSLEGPQGIQGVPGKDGHTPVITIQNGYWYIDGENTNVLAEGIKGETGNGISSVELTSSEGLVDIYTITFSNGNTTTFTVTNGKDGEQGIQGIQGEKGQDGLSAYELYCKYHPEYSGTEEEWVNDILMGGNNSSDEDICEGLSAKYVTGLGYYIDGYYGTATDIKIPSTILGEPVYGIAEEAFAYSSLTSIEIPTSLVSIEKEAFTGCSNLTTVTFEEGSQLKSIGYSAFRHCISLTSIEIPSNVTFIGTAAFECCKSLTTVTFEEGSQLTSIGQYVFHSISITSIEIPKGVTSIGEYAFYECSSLTTVTFEEGSQLKIFGRFAFYICSNLTSIEIPSGVTKIDDYVFYSNSLTSIEIPKGVTSIGQGAFAGSNLTSITLPEGVTSIGGNAFSNSSFLTSIVVPSSLTDVGFGAFDGCSRLKKVYYCGTKDECKLSLSDFYGGYIYYYQETRPITSGYYWHYDTDGVTPVVWQ